MKITRFKKFALTNFSEARDSSRAEYRPRVRLVFSVALKPMRRTTTAGRGPILPGEPEVVVGATLPRSRWCRVRRGPSSTTWRPRPRPWKTWALRMSQQRGNPQSGGRQGLLATKPKITQEYISKQNSAKLFNSFICHCQKSWSLEEIQARKAFLKLWSMMRAYFL